MTFKRQSMTFKRWIKFILFFPAMLALGNLEAGAEPVADSAEDQGNQGDNVIEAELNDQAAESDDNKAGETNSQEADKGDEANKDEVNKDKGAHQTTLEERAAEIAQKEIQKFRQEQAEIERQTAERLKAAEKPFVDLTPEQSTKLNSDYMQAVSDKLDLEEKIRLGDRDPATILALRQTEKWIHDTEAWFADNQAKKAEWTKKKGETEQLQAAQREKAQRLETTADVYRQANNIPQDVWDQSSQWFAEQLKTDKVLGLKFADAYRLHGDVGAVEFAHKYCTENMGKKAEADIEQKNTAKQNLAPGVSSSAVNTDPDVKRLYKEAMADPGNEAKYLAWREAKSKIKT